MGIQAFFVVVICILKGRERVLGEGQIGTDLPSAGSLPECWCTPLKPARAVTEARILECNPGFSHG